MIRKLPPNFVLGAAIAAYQVEGATKRDDREPCIWDKWLKRPTSTFDGDEASGFYDHYREDIARCQQYNIKALSLSFAWTRIMHEDGSVNEAGVAFYEDVIATCHEYGVEPFVALYHFDMPLHLFKRGGWLCPETTLEYLRYAKVCFTRFGDKVKHWITLKDPTLLARNQYITGRFPPEETGKVNKAIIAVHKMLTAHSKAVLLYKSLHLAGEIGLVHRAEPIYPIADVAENEQAAQLDNACNNDMLLDAVLSGSYSPSTMRLLNEILHYQSDSFAPAHEELAAIKEAANKMDFLGINYYASHFCEAWDGVTSIEVNELGQKGTDNCQLAGVSRRLQAASVPTTDWDWSIFPHGLYDMLMQITEKYPAKPIYITECGLGLREKLSGTTVEDDDRIDYLRQHLDAILDACEDGADVRGCFVWSLVDLMSWTSGYDKRYGLFYVDYATQARYPKKSACWLRDLAASRIMLTLSGFAGFGNNFGKKTESTVLVDAVE